MKRLGLTIGLGLLVVALPAAAAKTRIEFSVQDIQSANQTITQQQTTIELPAGSTNHDLVVKLSDLGKPKALNLPALPKQFQSNQTVYRFSADRDLLQPATATIELPFTGKSTIRKLLWLEQGSGAWQKLDTSVNAVSHTISARLPSSKGKLVAAKHKTKLPHPTKSAGFTDFGAPPHSKTAAVLDVDSGQFLYRYQAKDQRAIASVTKLLTLTVFMQTDPNLDQMLRYSPDYDRIGATVPLDGGTEASAKFFTMATLIPSANNAAVTIANNAGMTEAAFVTKMNETASELGANRTHVNEPTGLDSDNVSTAGNIAKIAAHAFTEYSDLFEEAVTTSQYPYTTPGGDQLTLYSTNKFDGHGKYRLHGFKTGYLPGSANRTLVVWAEDISSGQRIVAVLLGNPEYNTIFQEMYELVDWTFTNWQFP